MSEGATSEKKCKHEGFHVRADMGRITLEEGGPVVAFVLDLKVKCDQCGEAFAPLNVPGGLSYRVPTVSGNEGPELHIPMVPQSEWSWPTKMTFEVHPSEALAHGGGH